MMENGLLTEIIGGDDEEVEAMNPGVVKPEDNDDDLPSMSDEEEEQDEQGLLSATSDMAFDLF